MITRLIQIALVAGALALVPVAASANGVKSAGVSGIAGIAAGTDTTPTTSGIAGIAASPTNPVQSGIAGIADAPTTPVQSGIAGIASGPNTITFTPSGYENSGPTSPQLAGQILTNVFGNNPVTVVWDRVNGVVTVSEVLPATPPTSEDDFGGP